MVFNIVSGIALTCLLLSPAYAKYSKVVFFGDSLTDMGNNLPDAPVTNKIKNNGSYQSGETWAVPFVKNLKASGLLEDSATIEVRPSIIFDQSIQPNPGDSLDFAYSGDPSNGLIDGKVHYHPGCTEIQAPGSNALCGAYNRAKDAATHGWIDPNALYVIWVGANDIQGNLSGKLVEKIQSGVVIDPYAYDPAAARTIVEATDSIQHAIYYLKNKGAKNFVVINLPNLGYTAQGFGLNSWYAQIHKNPQDTTILTLFTQLTNAFNQELKKRLDNTAKFYGLTIYQPDINELFDQVRDGKIAALPTMINKTPVLSWVDTCCVNYSPVSTFDLATCSVSKDLPSEQTAQLCAVKDYGDSPKLDTSGNTYYLFFNAIHPSTCAHKYIARFIESKLSGGKAFDPSEKLCGNAG